MRNLIFISHASEDFEFSQWISLQLAKEGYGVWCDLTKLLGGENWPQEINEALQTRTQKFCFVLSRTSNKKDDPLNEIVKIQ
jgi:proline dehydrogenase